MLIEPEAARQYEASLRPPGGDGATGTDDDSGGTPSDGEPGTDSQTGTRLLPGTGTTITDRTAAAKLMTFHGSVKITPSTAKMRLVEIADELISILAMDPNASLDISVEINAECPSGASDQTRRAVTENATSLGFKTNSWE